ncbi:MAG: SUMF1/EgtB/PvdO family nonheme iron enzyme, partial [Nitrospinota bacterium]|nr:SUMF1/EgtB/PvdO family nonheme iron enzyme [Nitrospinota bacterium]
MNLIFYIPLALLSITLSTTALAFDVYKGIEPRSKKEKTPEKQIEKQEMVFIKGGCYQMGDSFGEGSLDEKPVHEVCVDDFYLGKYELT